jgi:hypothetical protein
MDSLNAVGEGKLFKNYNHMYKVVVEHNTEIKRTLKSDPLIGKKRFYDLIREFSGIPAWTRQERMELMIKHFGSVDVNQLVPAAAIKKFEKNDIGSIDDYVKPGVHWFSVADQKAKTSKNGRKYLILQVVGQAGKRHRMFMWSWDGTMMFESYAIVIGRVSQNEYGFITSQEKLRVLDV